MGLATKIVIWSTAIVLLLGGSVAGACKFALVCGIRGQQGDIPPIESGRAVLPVGWTDETVVAGLAVPTDFAFLPDGQVLISERDGLVKIATLDGTRPRVVLDLRDRVSTVDIRGLLTVTAHPDFPSEPYVYLLYTGAAAGSGMTPTTTYVSRFTWEGRRLAPRSERRLLEIPNKMRMPGVRWSSHPTAPSS